MISFFLILDSTNSKIFGLKKEILSVPNLNVVSP